MQLRMWFFLLSIIVILTNSCNRDDFPGQTGIEVKQVIQQYLEDNNKSANDPFEYDSIWKNVSYNSISISEPLWIIPSTNLPKDIRPQRSNNNVSIAFFNKKLYLAFRTGSTHFASKKTGMYIISTKDMITWTKELELFTGSDVREPFLIEINNAMHFYYFEAGQSMTAFEPKFISHFILNNNNQWQKQFDVLNKGEVHWSIKSRRNKIYLSSYAGSHYQLKGESKVSLFFKTTQDGTHFTSIEKDSLVYLGGLSETDFEFDQDGNLWAVSRLEDGDKTGFGSHVIYAPKENIEAWQFPHKAYKECYMSPKLFRQGNEIYLIARRQLGNFPFGRASEKKSLKMQRLINWLSYSLSSKTTSLYKIDKRSKKVEWVLDLPGTGDTAFPSIWRIDERTILVANYSSPIHQKNKTWLGGQLGKTGIYLLTIKFN
jgi:hypothetical protein